jgi:uncharacterized protein YjeT (DUF2065 family)
MTKQTAQEQKKFYRNVRIIGIFSVLFGVGFTFLFEFDLIALLFGLFFAVIGIGIALYPKSAKIYIDSLIETIATK